MNTIGTEPDYSSGKYVKNIRSSDSRNLMYMSDEQRLNYWVGQKHAGDMEANEKIVNADTKKCSRCGQTKHVDNFGRHPRSKDGYLSECKTCRGSKDAVSVHNLESEVKELLEAIPQPVNSKVQTVETLTDKVLADELRRRGYDVKATKTIEI